MSMSGVVKYTIDSPTTMSAAWCFSGLDQGELGRGEVEGDTSDGFAGDYRVHYMLHDGTDEGTFDLAIRKVESLYRLTWRDGGEVRFRGVGFEADGGLVASYAPAG